MNAGRSTTWALFAMAGCLCLQTTWAQPEVNYEGTVRINEIEGIGRKVFVDTPRFQTSVGQTPTRARKWGRILVEYETSRDYEWFDELAVTVHVLLAQTENGNPVYSLCSRSVVYIDVPGAEDHKSTMFIRPNRLARMGEVVGIGVEISVQGQAVTDSSETASDRIPPRFWENDRVPRSDGVLLTRDESPWALINMDDFQTIRQ